MKANALKMRVIASSSFFCTHGRANEIILMFAIILLFAAAMLSLDFLRTGDVENKKTLFSFS